jgi:hypothetical protein
MDACQFVSNLIWKVVLNVQQEYTYFNAITHAYYTTPTASQLTAIKTHFSTELILHNKCPQN